MGGGGVESKFSVQLKPKLNNRGLLYPRAFTFILIKTIRSKNIEVLINLFFKTKLVSKIIFVVSKSFGLGYKNLRSKECGVQKIILRT